MFGSFSMETEETNRKRKLALDWDNLLSKRQGDEEPPPPLVVINTGPQSPPSESDVTGGGDDTSKREFLENLTDKQLEEMIQRQNVTLTRCASTLPDKGRKTRDLLLRLEEERKRRRLSRSKLDADGYEKFAQQPSKANFSEAPSSSDMFGRQSKSRQALAESTFGASFRKKMEENVDCKIVNTFDKDLSILNCGSRKYRCNGVFSQRESLNWVSPRQMNSQHRKKPSFGNQKDRTPSIYSLRDHDLDNDFPSIAKKNASQVRPSNDSMCRKGQAVVLVDLEKSELVKTTEVVVEVELPNCKKDAKIYYPSRDDPESVEICFRDIFNLAPETFLTSQIMNFYIRFLQQQATSTNRAICNYHFFSTYFYQKLKEAMSYKGSGKSGFFIKFRRWWKGVNIFQKAYVLIPINEDFHWSLAVISIPDKEDESRPIILHMDSLGLHSSGSIFENIKSFLRGEWNYLNQEIATSNLPIGDQVWKNFPHRIYEKKVTVPRQKNDYDCGLFVLFFMERFIEEAPERMKSEDLAMFGTQWFKPEEASSLRVKIRNLLIEQFRSASEDIGG